MSKGGQICLPARLNVLRSATSFLFFSSSIVARVVSSHKNCYILKYNPTTSDSPKMIFLPVDSIKCQMCALKQVLDRGNKWAEVTGTNRRI